MRPEQVTDENDRPLVGFGPSDSLRTLTELQSQGIRAASDIAARLSSMFDLRALQSAEDGSPAAGDSSDQRAAVGEMRSTVTRLIDIYGNLIQRTFDAFADLIERPPGRGPQFERGSSGALEMSAPSADFATGELWVTNGTDRSAGPLSMVATGLSSCNGRVIPTDAFAFDPPRVEKLNARETRRIALSVRLDPGTEDGYYHGHVMVTELPGEALPVVLKVERGSLSGGAE